MFMCWINFRLLNLKVMYQAAINISGFEVLEALNIYLCGVLLEVTLVALVF
jgi:hypothetical protein